MPPGQEEWAAQKKSAADGRGVAALEGVVNGPAGSRFEFIRRTEIARLEPESELRLGNPTGVRARNAAVSARLDADPPRSHQILERRAALA